MTNRLKSEDLHLATVICYHIWSRRNGFVFKDQFSSPESILARAQTEIDMQKEVNQQNSSRAEGRTAAATSNQVWQPPEWPMLKVNVDAAFDKSLNRMGIGIIVRDSEGKVQACLTAPKERVYSAAQAERAALQRAMFLCSEMGMQQVVFEGDAKVVINAINSREVDSSWHGQESEDLQQWMVAHPFWTLVFVYRSANQAAHAAAKVAIRDSCEKIWLEDGPPVVKASVLYDVSRVMV